MCFMTKTNSRKSRIIIWATKNTPKILKIWKKFSRDILEHEEPNQSIWSSIKYILEHM